MQSVTIAVEPWSRHSHGIGTSSGIRLHTDPGPALVQLWSTVAILAAGVPTGRLGLPGLFNGLGWPIEVRGLANRSEGLGAGLAAPCR